MWHDTETTKDLLNFGVLADIAAHLVRESGDQPLSIGVSGGWGTGKSSLVKMIGASIVSADKDHEKYILLEFNAWLYQGYDDARMALLQSVSDKLITVAESRQSCVDKAKEFAKRVNWFRLGKLLAPVVSGAVMGGTLGGPFGAVLGAAGGLCKAGSASAPEELEKLKTAYADLGPELEGLLNDKRSTSLPQEIARLRTTFADLLEELDVKLVVLVDDLDRCLPPTAISTLEAMRLLLFMPRTAFIIAADEQMIRGAVRVHFGNVDLGDDLVTSYFDKLIQVPLSVPRLGTTEIRAYLILLLADRAVRNGTIDAGTLANAETAILNAVRQSWTGALTRKAMEDAFGKNAAKLSTEIDLADQLAGLMVSADRISGNPRLIKRFLNNLVIRDAVARAEGMTITFDELVKLQLFERCASPAAFEYLVKCVAGSDVGKADFLGEIESQLAKGEDWKAPHGSWGDDFVKQWVRLSPRLGDTDLRPLLHLSRDRALLLASFDELSPDGRVLLDSILETQNLMPPLIEKLRQVGETEAERILNRILRRARSNQWDLSILQQALHVPRAFPVLGETYARALSQIPATQRQAPLVARLINETWAAETLRQWGLDEKSHSSVKKAVKLIKEIK